MRYRINTSNPNKLAEYQRLLGSEVQASTIDVREPLASPLTIVQYKASQFEGVLVEDVSLDVEGADVGSNVKWLLEKLPELQGRRALFRCLLGIQLKGEVCIYRGEVAGRLILPRGEGFGFDPLFEPEGSHQSLAEAKPDHLNARALAVADYLNGKSWQKLPPLPEWKGPFQNES